MSVLKSYAEMNAEQKLAYQMGYAAAEEIAARGQGDALVTDEKGELHCKHCLKRIKGIEDPNFDMEAALSDRSDTP